MTSRIRSALFIVLITSLTQPAWGQQYQLYAPQPAASGRIPDPNEGILVQEIEIQKGDTLYDLSKKFSGRGMYYPQILLFNAIKNPDLIYQGKMLKVPVTQKETPASNQGAKKAGGAAVTLKTPEQSTPHELKSAGTEKSRSDSPARKSTVAAKKKSTAGSSAPNPVQKSKAAAGQRLFEAAVQAYRRDDCAKALDLLDRYLADNAGSPLAADANLYKAECYLKLSAQ